MATGTKKTPRTVKAPPKTGRFTLKAATQAVRAVKEGKTAKSKKSK